MAAYDRLPRQLRLLLSFGPYRANPIDAENALRAGQTAAQVESYIRAGWRGTPRARAIREWAKWTKTEYPHFAARATIMWTEPLGVRDRLQARRLARLRLPAPNVVLRVARPPVPDVIRL